MRTVFKVGQVLWSLEDKVLTMGHISDTGEWESSGYTRVDTRWVAWTVESVTPKGAWVQEGLATDTLRGTRMWVAYNTHKVATTKQRAKDHAVSKRAYHTRMCRERLASAEHRLHVIQAVDVDPEETSA
jgi:hypothetical protein